jgi:hypothetical protein
VGFFDRGEAHTRSFLKAVSWRITGSVDRRAIPISVNGMVRPCSYPPASQLVKDKEHAMAEALKNSIAFVGIGIGIGKKYRGAANV